MINAINNKDFLGDNLTQYENDSRIFLPKKTPVIIRVIGKSINTLSKNLKKPFDEFIINAMQETMKFLCEHIHGCKLAYTHPYEINLLLIDYDKANTTACFNNDLQKLVSVTASMATMKFNKVFSKSVDDFCKEKLQGPEPWKNLEDCDRKYINNLLQAASKGAFFESKAFALPQDEVNNYFTSRQTEFSFKSIMIVAQAHFKHEYIQNKTSIELQHMLYNKKCINYSDFPVHLKRGSCCIRERYFTPHEKGEDTYINPITGNPEPGMWKSRWIIEKETPIFSRNPEYINDFVYLLTDDTKN